MEYETVIRIINPLGRYQILTIILLCFGVSLNSLTSFVVNFIFTEHPHRCKVPKYLSNTYNFSVNLNVTNGLQYINVHDCDIEINNTRFRCDSWIYEDNFFQTTIISKFNIVCDKILYRAHFIATNQAGQFVGSIFGGVFADIFGRKPMLAVSYLAILISMVTRPFLDNFTLVVAMEFFNGFGSMCSYLIQYIMIIEMIGRTKRTFASYWLYFGYCFGYYIFLVIVYFVRYWEDLMIAVGIPCGVYLLFFVFLDETPRWLFSRGKKKKALSILLKMARINRRPIHLKVTDITLKNEQEASFLVFFRQMLKAKPLLWRLLIISLCWYSINVIYVGISMNVARFGDNVFVNFAISSTAEVLGITVSWFAAEKMGRKKLFCSAMIIGGLACFCTIFTTLYTQKSRGWVTTTLAMVGKFFVTITFFVVYLFTGEMFPTVLRGTAFGFVSMVGRIGSISSAYIGELGTLVPTKLGQALPLVIYGVFGLLAGLMSLYLPETRKVVLPDFVEDAENINKKVKEEAIERELQHLQTEDKDKKEDVPND